MAVALQVKVPVCVFVFDCLFVDGETLLKESLEVRRARMAAALPNMQPGFVCLAKSHRLQVLHPHQSLSVMAHVVLFYPAHSCCHCYSCKAAQLVAALPNMQHEFICMAKSDCL